MVAHETTYTQTLTFIDAKASEVARISGLTPLMQRQWRMRGHLPDLSDSKKRAGYSPLQLVQIWIMKMFSDRGIGPTTSEGIAGQCARAVISRALQSPDAYLVDEQTSARFEPELCRAQLLEAVLHGVPHSEIIRQTPRFFVWFADDQMFWADRLDEVIGKRSGGASAGPALFLDLHSIANDLLREAGHLVAVDVRNSKGGLTKKTLGG